MEEKIKEYYNELAEHYDENRFGNSYGKYVDFQERSILKRYFKSQKFDKILDLGCGTGRLLDFATHGVDFSEKMLKNAQIKFPEKTLKIGTISQISFDDNSFDCIFCFHVIMHQDKVQLITFLKECQQKLKDNGILIFDYISKFRRTEKSQQNQWHSNNSFDEKEIAELVLDDWQIKNKYGVLLFPVHRFSERWRKFLLPLDTFLCRTFIKKWASYQVLILEKK